MSCRLTEAFRAADAAPRLPTHPRAHFGILAHAFLHESARGAFAGLREVEVRAAWNRSVEAYEQKLNPADQNVIPLAETCDDFEVDTYRLIAAAGRLSPPLSRPAVVVRTPQLSGAEVEMASGDRQIVGRLDRVGWENGQLIITDVKTGSPLDPSGNLRSGLKIQLMLYGYLLHERFGQWPATMRILPLTGEPITVPFVREQSEGLANELKQMLREVNKEIAQVQSGDLDEASLAAPSIEACRFCRYRPICEAYWTARMASADDRWPRDIAGRLESIKPLGGGFRVLAIRSANGVTQVVRGIKRDALIVTENVPVRVCDLRPERAANVYSWRPTSYIGVANV